MSISSKKEDFKVIIAGGGVGGLLLANCLERANVEYVLLEARHEITPQVGASIGIMPNGARILDQLGVYDEFMKSAVDLTAGCDRYVNGQLIYKMDAPSMITKRTGYHPAFGDRQNLLQCLYERLPDKTKIVNDKRVAHVEQSQGGVQVVCTDGTSYTGDIIVGADGVYSKVRQEMWRHADAAEPGLIPIEEKTRMKSEYRCMYGIAQGLEIEYGTMQANLDHDRSTLIIEGKNKRIYFFIFEKLDQTYKVPNLPRYTEEQTQEFAKRHADIVLVPGTTFEDVWKKAVSYCLVPLEEAGYDTWTWGRIACLGDSIAKMTPNAGQGGNAAIESAAEMANQIKAMVDDTTRRPSQDQIEDCLKNYQQIRQQRLPKVMEAANALTRLQAWKSPVEQMMCRFVIPQLGDAFVNMHSDLTIGASMLNYIPPPRRSVQDTTMPFNPQQGDGRKESKLKRVLFGLPLLVLFVIAPKVMDLSPFIPQAEKLVESKTLEWNGTSFPLPQSFYGIPFLDNMLAPIVVFFMYPIYGVDEQTWWQMLSFLTDLTPMLAIYWIESTRQINALTFQQFPMIFWILAQLIGCGVVMPLYYFLYYISSPIENYKATDMRLTNLRYTRTVLPVLLAVYTLPLAQMYFNPDPLSRNSWNWFWQPMPVWIAAGTWGLSKFLPNTLQADRMDNPKRDLPVIRYTVGTFAFLAAATWWSSLALSPYSARDFLSLFVPRELLTSAPDVATAMRVMLQWDEAFFFTSTFIWLTLLFWDLKHAGMLAQSWVRLVGCAALSVVALGPGATAALGWLWREDAITNRRHKSAVVSTWAVDDAGEVEKGKN